MKTQIKGIAMLLAVILTFSGLLVSSSASPVSDDILSAPPAETTAPTTAPTTETTTAPTTEPTTAPTTEPTTVPTTVPPTEPPTVPPTVPPTEPPATQPPAPPVTTPPVTQPPVQTPQDAITASHAFIYNNTTGAYLFHKGDMNARIYPASITKLFTALVALQYLTPEQTVTAGDALYTVPSDSSKAFLQFGDVLTVEQLIYGMLLPSGNDAARVLAAAAGRVIAGNDSLSAWDAMAVFVGEMNNQAPAMGLTTSHFVNPDGVHSSEHYTSMADLLTLARLCLSDPLISQVVKTPQYTATLPTRQLHWKNSNMHLQGDSEFYLPNCIGLKTGYTHSAGRCLLSAFMIGNSLAIMGVFGCPDPGFTYITQFQASSYLYSTYLAA